MTPGEWNRIKQTVADKMCAHTRPCVTPLGTTTLKDVPRLVGTGSYVIWNERPLLLTCEHVVRGHSMHYRFHGSNDVFEHRGPWTMDRHPIDAAFALLTKQAWEGSTHDAACVPQERFASVHRVSQAAELLFFRGFAGENANYAFGIHQTNGSCYCTQEKLDSGDTQTVELLWEPEHTEITDGTSDDARAEIRFDNAGGFSGSLVWNTRYLEVTDQGGDWTPEDAVVTALLRRWDQHTRTLLAWRIEHLRGWLDSKNI